MINGLIDDCSFLSHSCYVIHFRIRTDWPCLILVWHSKPYFKCASTKKQKPSERHVIQLILFWPWAACLTTFFAWCKIPQDHPGCLNYWSIIHSNTNLTSILNIDLHFTNTYLVYERVYVQIQGTYHYHKLQPTSSLHRSVGFYTEVVTGSVSPLNLLQMLDFRNGTSSIHHSLYNLKKTWKNSFSGRLNSKSSVITVLQKFK